MLIKKKQLLFVLAALVRTATTSSSLNENDPNGAYVLSFYSGIVSNFNYRRR